MKKSNKLQILVTCILLVLAMVGAVYAESLPADEFVCICEHEHNSEVCNAKCPVCNPTYTGTYKSPCACCLPPVVMFEAEAPVTYDGTEHKLGAFKIKFSQEPPVVTCDNARVEYAGIDAATEMEVWNVYATNAGTYTIKANVVGLKENNLDPRTFTEEVEIAKAPVTIAFNKDAINYLYHENDLEVNKTYLSVADHTTIEGVVEGEEIAYEVVADLELENDETRFVKVNPEGYAWRIVCKTEDYSNYAITVGNPAKVIVNYWEGVQLDFTSTPNAAGWHNAANKATIALAEGSGLSIAKALNGTYGTVVTDYVDADADDEAYGVYFLENANGARTAAMKTVSTYKQDSVNPEAVLTANGGGWYKIQTKDIANDGVMSDVNVVELLSGNGTDMKVFRTVLGADGAGDTYQVIDGYYTFNGIFKFVAQLQVRVEDEAGNVITSNIISDYNSDKDGDGLNNLFEGVSADSEDYDEDGLTDYYEETSGYSDRLLFDTDEDGLSDGVEHMWGLNARKADSDNDGVSDPAFVRYMEAMGLKELDIELGMLLMQSNLNRANNQDIVPAADLVMLKDGTFQMDNGAENAYSEMENRTGLFGQLNRYSKHFYMLRYDERDHVAVYLTATNNGTFYLVKATITNRGLLNVEAAYETPYTTENSNLAASTSADGNVVVLAPWADGKTGDGLVLFELNSGVQFRFGGIADTVGATRFTLSNDGAVLAYVGADKLLHTINMTKEEYADVEYNGNALHFMADGQLMTNVDETAPNGVYHVEQPTIQRVSVVLVDDGVLSAMEINGHFFYRNYALYCQIDDQKRTSNGIRINDLFKKAAKK